MTKEALLKAITEGKLFKTIDQSEEFSDFIHARENEIGMEVIETPEFMKAQREREQLEEEFLSLYSNSETGRKKILMYGDLIDQQGAISDIAHYQTGFTEGIKFIVGMLME